jgi:release factor glutamine methyltransferase
MAQKIIGRKQEENTIRILDICTGSGCIAITLGLDIGGSEVTGWDISEDALKIAQGNVALLDAGNVKIEYQDALKLAETSDAGRWNIIVSNPPYICEKEKADMEKNVLAHEPGIALFVPDEEPLKFYRAIAEYASSALKSGGALYFEINPIYEKETREMLEGLGFKAIDTKEDAFGKQRMMRAGKGIYAATDASLYSFSYYQIGARRRLAVMRAGFETHIDGSLA